MQESTGTVSLSKWLGEYDLFCFQQNSVLFFLAGTCVNNTSVMMFKKGGFEVSPIVYPVAIKVSVLCFS